MSKHEKDIFLSDIDLTVMEMDIVTPKKIEKVAENLDGAGDSVKNLFDTSDAKKFVDIRTDLLKSIEDAEKNFLSRYAERYAAGDLSFLVSSGDDDGITKVSPDLLPRIEQEFEAYKKELGIDEITLDELLFGIDPEQENRLVLDIIMDRARRPASAADEKEIHSIRTRRPGEIKIPTDKFNKSIVKMKNKENSDIVQMFVNTDPDNKKCNPGFLVIADFSELPIDTKRFTEYQMRVLAAVNALFEMGYDTMSDNMICDAMGYHGTVGDNIKKKVHDALTALAARTKINNNDEIEANYKYPGIHYDGDFLVFERLTGNKNNILFNGKKAKFVIKVFRQPIAYEIAEGRGQITTVPAVALQSPLSLTESNISVENYCIRRIAEHKRQGKKILFTTLFRSCGVTSNSQKSKYKAQRIPELFKHYKNIGLIEGYKINKDAIVFVPRTTPKKLT